MSLFETGFAVDKLQPASSLSNGNKRKRPDASEGEVGQTLAQTPTINIERLMKRLAETDDSVKPAASTGGKQNKGGKGKVEPSVPVKKDSGSVKRMKAKAALAEKLKRQQEAKAKAGEAAPTEAETKEEKPEQPKPSKKAKKEKSSDFVYDEEALAKQEARKLKKAAKAAKKQPEAGPSTSAEPASVASEDVPVAPQPAIAPAKASQASAPPPAAVPSGAMTALQKSMQKKLGGARFRWINEQLYTTSGDRALELMKEDPSMFEEYHSGFRSQASGWPSSPISIFTSSILSAYSGTAFRPTICDMGCGDATLAKALIPKGFPVHSFDLVSDNEFVVAAQCTQPLPLPGGNGAVVDIVVCCLSLMGNDWLKMVTESWRILKVGGKLKIAEVSSRFPDLKAFIELIKEQGFKNNSKDDSNTHFVLFEFTKVPLTSGLGKRDVEADLVKSQELLKPCVYKKR